jgi:hypothetical protein
LVASTSTRTAAAQPASPPGEGPQNRTDASPAPDALTPPILKRAIDVPYPPDVAPADRTAQTVVLTVTVNADGTVRAAQPLEGAEPFASVARDAVLRAEFAPARRGDKPVAATVRLAVDFTPPVIAEVPVEAPTDEPAEAPPGAAVPLEEVRVAGSRPAPTAPGVVSLGRGEIRQLPGAFGDPFRAIDVLPGVTPILSGLPYFFVRGAPPGNVGYYIDGVRVPYLFHFGLGPGVIHPSLIDRVDLYPGGYPAAFGRFAGAVVSAETTLPKPTLHGEGSLRLVDAGALVEAPFAGGKGQALVAGRYSYTAALLSLLAPEIQVDYRDYQARVAYALSPKDTLSLFSFGAFDLAAEREDGRRNVLFASEFHRVDVRYDRALGPEGATARLALTGGFDRSRLGGERFATDRLIGLRGELQHPLGKRALLRTGFDATFDIYSTDPLPPFSDDDEALAEDAKIFATRFDDAIAARGDVVWKLTDRFEMTPGLRLETFGSGGVRAFVVEPRLATRTALTEKLRLVQAAGIVHQPPAFPVPIPAIAIARLAGGLQRAVQTSAGVEADLPDGMTGGVTLFHNGFFSMNDALGTASRASEDDDGQVTRRSRGSAYGAELSVRRKLTRRLGGLLSYTLSRSVRSLERESFPSSFDRTHVLNAALTFDLGKDWRAGTRLLLYSGIPVSPTDARGERYDPPPPERTPLFYRIDLRLEKRWRIGRTGYFAFIFEGLNMTLNREVVGYNCVPGAACRPDKLGPVAVPSLGLEGGF